MFNHIDQNGCVNAIQDSELILESKRHGFLLNLTEGTFKYIQLFNNYFVTSDIAISCSILCNFNEGSVFLAFWSMKVGAKTSPLHLSASILVPPGYCRTEITEIP